ncbi:hypothetical protein E2C01_072183 [Portunus trituberculatus]|uniref:Uncharacterized protein n=1 Tax=Portunus trituberculatus TaxID=210409 RepID=A0A5B7I741_PORTR|nr:hypothetical protein [Portunus trituberculatus]
MNEKRHCLFQPRSSFTGKLQGELEHRNHNPSSLFWRTVTAFYVLVTLPPPPPPPPPLDPISHTHYQGSETNHTTPQAIPLTHIPPSTPPHHHLLKFHRTPHITS